MNGCPWETIPIFCGRKLFYGCNGVGVGVGGEGRHLNLQPQDKCALPFKVWTIKTRCFLPIQNDTCALAMAFYFWLMMNGCSWEKSIFFFFTKMSYSRGFQPRTLGFMPNDVPFEVDFDLSSCQTELRVPRTQWHKGQDLWFCNQLLVNQFCTSYWYRYLKIRSLFCIWFGNRFIVYHQNENYGKKLS